MFGLGHQEILLLIVLGVLLFGRKLPEVGRSLGKSIVEFKNGLRGIEDDLHSHMDQTPTAQQQQPIRPPQKVAASAPKFEETEPTV